MPERILAKRVGDALVPVNAESREIVKSLKAGDDYAVDVSMLRNSDLHRKAFAYLKLAFQYWEPDSLLTKTETRLVQSLARFLSENGIGSDAASELCRQFLARLESSRKGMELAKDFAAFREFVTVEAGFFKLVITPAGPRREARSWAYKNMSDAEFQRLFQSIRNVCWDLVLSKTFQSQEEAEMVAGHLMAFD